MSKLQELIRALCPDGVEYKKLGEIGTFTRGNGLQKKDFTESGVGCIHYGQIYTHYGFYTTQTKSFVDESLAHKLTKVQKGNLIIACTSENIEDVCKAVAWLGNEDIVTGGHACVFAHNENPKYISYFFQTEMFFQQKRKYARGAKVIDIKVSDLSKIEIPVPPPPVQEEIVRILDHFTTLAAELQAELQARKEQYEYYRNKLLTFDKIGGGTQSVTWVKMSEICKIYTGGEPPKDAIKGNYKDSMHPYPIWGNGKEVYGYASSYKIDKDATVISSIGANAGTVYFRKAYFTPIIRLKVLIPKNDNILSKFLYFYLSTVSLAVKSSSVPNMNANDVKKLLIPIPSLAEQQRIVSILDKFEALVNDLTEGLPAEIAAVQEQYEYYRNKILSFPRIRIGA